MKKNVIFLVSLMLSVVAIGQNETKNLMEEFEVSPPKFISVGNAAAILTVDNDKLVNDYLTKHLIYPQNAAKCYIDGTEIVQFTVTPSGDLTNFNVINSVCPEIDKEVISVLQNTNGMWIPGLSNGEPTAMEKEVKIPFAFCHEYNVVEHFTRKATMYYKAGIKSLMGKNKPGKALHYFNMGIRYLPNDNALLLMRGLCNYQLGDTASAKKDWTRVASLGGTLPREFDYDLLSMKGYSEMQQVLNK